MGEQKKLLKKAVLAGVGASTSVDRVKNVLIDAMQDLVKVGQELFDELESKGQDKADNLQKEFKKIKEEAARRTLDTEKLVSTKVQGGTRKFVKDAGLVTREELEEVLDRLAALEEAVHGTTEANGSEEEGTAKKRGRKKAQDVN